MKNAPKNNHLLKSHTWVKELPEGEGKPYAVHIKNDITRRNDSVTWYATEAEAVNVRDTFNDTNKDGHRFAVAFLCEANPSHPMFS